jgi:polyisoprenoid-binding protein YceI
MTTSYAPDFAADLTAAGLSAGTWSADAAHSTVQISVRHMAVGKVKGTFAVTSGTLTVDETGIPGSAVTAVIDAGSVDTKNADRDKHVRSADFLDAETFPTIEFNSTGVESFDGETFALVGNLTLHGVTKQVRLAAEFLGETVDAYGLTRTGFSATTSINRKDYGVTIELAFGAGNKVVGDKIDIAIEIEFVKNA